MLPLDWNLGASFSTTTAATIGVASATMYRATATLTPSTGAAAIVKRSNSAADGIAATMTMKCR